MALLARVRWISSLLRRGTAASTPQKTVVNATRTVRGNPGEMFVLLSAFRKYFRSRRFSTLA